ncbi:MAG: tRNA (adenosine(37)-N6)-threonylcarbamoyltransferase complex dimerization subunit type 1 TsaB [Alphaproteobacteria bacterium]|jgi:tRNA threonylcarbamoyladenosine biosynthesis protein TsaB|nr:tRNA (adenosine(37)-N6)-threonylcarbamoyltransferase complex dimerization subunit type 1 TsaB [Alphaproteobacteria bacterium]
MKILAVDTCSSKCSVAITDEENVLYSLVKNMPRGHSEALFPMIEEALKETSLDINDIDAFACSVGPGAFTGIRVGISSIKALATATDKPCVGVQSALAIAKGLSKDDMNVLIALESKRSDVYWQLFDTNLEPINDISLSMASDVADSLKGEKIKIVGDGYVHFEELMSNAKFDNETTYPKPENICKIALEYIKKETYKGTCEPVYLRDADVSKPKKLIIPRIVK